MKRNTIVKAYILIMVGLCLSLSSMLVYLSITRGNDWGCNVLAIIIASVIPLVWTAWPSSYSVTETTNDLVNDITFQYELQRTIRKQYRAELKKRLKTLDTLN